LSISRSVAAAHGGRLSGENNGGQNGATFHLELPADVRRGERYYS
jgi:signal transduction histidine kinase